MTPDPTPSSSSPDPIAADVKVGASAAPQAAVTVRTDASGLNRWNLLLFFLAFAPLLPIFASNLWSRSQYQFFPMALAGAAFLGWTRAKELGCSRVPGHPGLTALLLACSLGLLSTGVLLWSPWLAMVATWVGLAGMVWWKGGWRLLSALFPALLLVLIIIPPPLSLDESLMLHLRGIAVTWSSRLLDHLGVIHSLAGNVIALPKQKLMVEEACSGINSVLLTSTCCIFYLFWRRRGLLCILITLPVVVGGVLLGNVFRITLGAWLRFNEGIDLLSGWPHEVLGLVLLLFYLGLILSLEHLLYWPARKSSESAPQPRSPQTPLPRRIAPHWGWVAAGLFVAVGLGGLPRGWAFHQRMNGSVAAKSTLREGTQFAMPEQIGDWRRLEKEAPTLHKIETLGISSQMWNYKRGNIVATVAFDYPFRGYHDVMVCYKLAGWKVVHRDDTPASADGTPSVVKLRMDKEPVSYGYLWYSTINERGRWIDGTATQRNFINRWAMDSDLSSYRIQVLVSGNIPLSESEWNATQRFFEAAREGLTRQFLDQIQPK